MSYCPDPAAWRKGAEAVARNLLQPLLSRRLVRARFWPRRWSFFRTATLDVHPTDLATPAAPAPERVAGLLWQSEIQPILWEATRLRYTAPRPVWMYADLSLHSLLAPSPVDDRAACPAGFARTMVARPARPMRWSLEVDQMLAQEPWFGAIPFQTYMAVLVGPEERERRRRAARPQMPTETAIPALVTPLRIDAAQTILERSARSTRDQSPLALGNLPMRPLRASNTNVLPLSRHQAPRRSMRKRRAGLR